MSVVIFGRYTQKIKHFSRNDQSTLQKAFALDPWNSPFPVECEFQVVVYSILAPENEK